MLLDKIQFIHDNFQENVDSWYYEVAILNNSNNNNPISLLCGQVRRYYPL